MLACAALSLLASLFCACLFCVHWARVSTHPRVARNNKKGPPKNDGWSASCPLKLPNETPKPDTKQIVGGLLLSSRVVQRTTTRKPPSVRGGCDSHVEISVYWVQTLIRPRAALEAKTSSRPANILNLWVWREHPPNSGTGSSILGQHYHGNPTTEPTESGRNLRNRMAGHHQAASTVGLLESRVAGARSIPTRWMEDGANGLPFQLPPPPEFWEPRIRPKLF